MECVVSVSVLHLKEWHLLASLCFTVILADFVVICYVGLPVVALLNMHMCGTPPEDMPTQMKLTAHSIFVMLQL